jgi:hypothetical protein
MNHPDLHFEAFTEFLKTIPSDILRWPLAQIARWWKATHIQGVWGNDLSMDLRSLEVTGKSHLEQIGAVLDISLPPTANSLRWQANNVHHARMCVRGHCPWLSITLDESSLNGFAVKGL